MQTNPEPELPDPNGPPVPAASKEWLGKSVSVGLKICLGGLATLTALACFPQRTMGALRSQRIKWQERQQEIADVVTTQPAHAQSSPVHPQEPPHD